MEKPWLSHYEDVVPHTLEYPAIPLHCLLENAAHKYPANPALTLALRYLGPLRIGARMSYAQLLHQADRFAAAFHALGVRKGDRVAVALPNVPATVVTAGAAAVTLMAGMVATFTVTTLEIATLLPTVTVMFSKALRLAASRATVPVTTCVAGKLATVTELPTVTVPEMGKLELSLPATTLNWPTLSV